MWELARLRHPYLFLYATNVAPQFRANWHQHDWAGLFDMTGGSVACLSGGLRTIDVAACGAYIPVAGSYPLYYSATLPIVDSLTPEDWEDLQKRFVGVTGVFWSAPDLKNSLLIKICAEDKVNEEHTRHISYLASVIVSVWLLMVTPAYQLLALAHLQQIRRAGV